MTTVNGMSDAVWHTTKSPAQVRHTRPAAKRIDPTKALETAIYMCENMAVKFEVEDVDGELLTAAEVYTAQYTGTFEYMVSMQDALRRYKGLTVGQAKGVLNCMRADVQRRMSLPVQGKVVSTERKVKNGTYTVIIGDGSYVTLHLDDADTSRFDNLSAGSQIASYLNGPDNQYSYTGFAFVSGTVVKVWKRYQGANRLTEALDVLLNGDAEQAGKRYAMESGNCYVCNRKLTTPESIEAGIGPTCAGK